MFDRQMYLNRDHDALSTMYIAAERSITSTGQGIKQLAFNLGEKMDLVEEGTTAEYTKKINQETEIYENSLVGQSKLAQATGFATDMAIGFVLPEVKVVKLGKIGQAAVSGMFQSSLAPTKDGSLVSNAKNAASGLVAGAAQGIAFDEAGKLLNKGLNKLKVEKPHSAAANDAQYAPFSPKLPPSAANDVQYGSLSSEIPPVKTKVPEEINQPSKKPIVFSNQAKAIVKPTPKIKENSTQNTKNVKSPSSEKKPKK